MDKFYLVAALLMGVLIGIELLPNIGMTGALAIGIGAFFLSDITHSLYEITKRPRI